MAAPRTQHASGTGGFTLIELLVAMGLAGLVMAGIVATYQTQVRSHSSQQRVVDMQQNARAAIYFLARELRLAGFDPTHSSGAGIETANPGEVTFTMDLNADRDTDDDGERITYALSNDTDKDGVNDFGTPTAKCNLTRDNGNGPVIIAENIDVLNIVYFDKDAVTPPLTNDDIRTVQILLVARDAQSTQGMTYAVTDRRNYENQMGTTVMSARNDGFRRTRLAIEIKLRNYGLK